MTPPRVELAALPTPLTRATRLERALGAGPIFVKRDDLTGFGVAGNKARALEYLVGAAVSEKCDVLVAGGSASSNFCAAVAMAARVVGLDCELLFASTSSTPSTSSANVELARAAGARLVFDADAVREHACALRRRARRPYALPRGGATAVGAIGYAYAARELADQCAAAGVAAETIVVATGSGATLAGLVAGQAGLGLPGRLVGASVSRPIEGFADDIVGLARACAAAIGLREPTDNDVDVRDCRGPGFGVAAPEDQISRDLALCHEGLLLDDYYGAKAMTLLRQLLAADAATPAVFWHTGGVLAALDTLSRRARGAAS
jgi:D-cysteine desulfhydrase